MEALRGIDLDVPTGTVLGLLGLLGPNGAGKTTAVRILTTTLQPSRGRATVAGFDVVAQPHEVRSSIGLAGQFAAVDENLTGRENLTLVGRLAHLPKAVARERAGTLLYGIEQAWGRLVQLLFSRRTTFLAIRPFPGDDTAHTGEPGRAPRRGRLATGSADVEAGRAGVVGGEAVGDAHEVVTVPGRELVQGGRGLEHGPVEAGRLDAAGVHARRVDLVEPTLDDVFLTLTGGVRS